MVLCVESLIAEQGSESIKLETQVVITENGYQALDSFPYENVNCAGFSLRGRSWALSIIDPGDRLA